MKIAARNIDSFLDGVDDAVAAVLLYGPDAGLVRERSDRLAATVAGDAADPFRVSEVTAERLREQPSLLADEAAALTFGGGRRVVRLRTTGDAQSGAVSSFLRSAAGGGLLIVESDELGPRSSLRQLFEAAGNAAALPCYRDEGADLARFIVEELRREGLGLASEARDYLAGALGGDRAVTRREIEKVIAYMGPAPAGRTVELADAVACAGDSAALSIDDLVFAVGDGDLAATERLTTRVMQDGMAPVSILRAIGRYFLRVHLIAAAGANRERAMQRLRPPVFSKHLPRFNAHVRRWQIARLHQVLERLTRAESECKTTGAPAETLCRRALMEIAALAPKASRLTD
jgi:DNA polymerase-3 subunit delta